MSDRPRPLVAGNWKMNGLSASLAEIVKMAQLYQGRLAERLDLVVCPPATLIHGAAAVAAPVAIGGQDCHAAPSGAHTGDISATMLADAGAPLRDRRPFRTPRTTIMRPMRWCGPKREAAFGAGLTAILCVGETRGRARSRPYARHCRRPARGFAAVGGRSRQSGYRLRAGLGDRQRSHADASPKSPTCTVFFVAAGRRARCGGGQGPASLRRFRQARQCVGSARRRRCRRCAGRRREPESRGVHGDRRRL